MDDNLGHLNKIDPLLRSLANGDPDFYDELRQRTALSIWGRVKKVQPVTLPLVIGIAKHAAYDMVSERHRQRQRFVLFTDVSSGADTDGCDRDRSFVDAACPDLTFETVWAKLCCAISRSRKNGENHFDRKKDVFSGDLDAE